MASQAKRSQPGPSLPVMPSSPDRAKAGSNTLVPDDSPSSSSTTTRPSTRITYSHTSESLSSASSSGTKSRSSPSKKARRAGEEDEMWTRSADGGFVLGPGNKTRIARTPKPIPFWRRWWLWWHNETGFYFIQAWEAALLYSIMISFIVLMYYASIHYFPNQVRFWAQRASYYLYGDGHASRHLS